MGRETKRLTARTVAGLATPGRYADGGNLYLSISDHGGRRWVFLYRWQGKQREMGLGSARDVGLARARELADAARALLAEGKSPLAERKAEEAMPTFAATAESLIDSIAAGFRNAKHLDQWRMTLSVQRDDDGALIESGYCMDLRNKLVAEVTTEDVLAVLQPIWIKKAETASRVRGRIERVLDAAKAKGLRSSENPARWRGHLDSLLSKRQKLQRGHHAALPYAEVPAFIAVLRTKDGAAARALEFLILTAGRSAEVIGAKWSEIDAKAKLWTVPAARMKGGKEHRVPLAPRAIVLLEEMRATRPSGCTDADFIFPGGKRGKPLSVMALDMLLRRLEVDVTVHGFRSSFRDWAGEETSFSREVAEAALAHTVGNEVERAYRRGDALEKRRRLMDAWAAFLEGTEADNVRALNAG